MCQRIRLQNNYKQNDNDNKKNNKMNFQVTELLITHGANVNAMDLWQFTPLHEAASKSRTEVKENIPIEDQLL